MKASILTFCLVAMTSTLTGFAQSTVNVRGEYVPTEQDVERNKRIIEVLRKPATFFSLRLNFSSKRESEEVSVGRSFGSDDHIEFELVFSHQHFEPIAIWQSLSPHQDIRVELLRDGIPLTYSKKAQKQVERSDREPASGSGAESLLVPGKEFRSRITLKDWYGPLESGYYQVIVKKRFISGGEWLQSNSLTIEIR